MLALNSLSDNQKSQLRNAFTLIDGDSRDSTITKSDLTRLYKNLDMKVPSNADISKMLRDAGADGKEGINFTQFLNTMAKELLKFNDRFTIYNSLKAFADEGEHNDSQDLLIDVEKLKEACCSVQLGEIGSGDHRLSRTAFENLVKGFVKEQSDGKKVLNANQWLAAYID
ncbi:uncharacterized protein PRCAT00002238001 [Priceomyces carsonii]|uniref:uncharacterized protein n=1 Tax=Priceomyces carsonii TaxID=28549 RepID=UPI002ED9263F|nr:unnamed protein product [Priceomyces carsonii]